MTYRDAVDFVEIVSDLRGAGRNDEEIRREMGYTSVEELHNMLDDAYVAIGKGDDSDEA